MLSIAKVMACGFITFYAVPFLVRLTMMVATQVAVGSHAADDPDIHQVVQQGSILDRTRTPVSAIGWTSSSTTR